MGIQKYCKPIFFGKVHMHTLPMLKLICVTSSLGSEAGKTSTCWRTFYRVETSRSPNIIPKSKWDFRSNRHEYNKNSDESKICIYLRLFVHLTKPFTIETK